MKMKAVSIAYSKWLRKQLVYLRNLYWSVQKGAFLNNLTIVQLFLGEHKGENDLLQVYANESVFFHLRTLVTFKMRSTNQILTCHNNPAQSNYNAFCRYEGRSRTWGKKMARKKVQFESWLRHDEGLDLMFCTTVYALQAFPASFRAAQQQRNQHS